MLILNSGGHSGQSARLATVNMGTAKNMGNQKTWTERRQCEGAAAATGYTAAFGPWCQLLWTVI